MNMINICYPTHRIPTVTQGKTPHLLGPQVNTIQLKVENSTWEILYSYWRILVLQSCGGLCRRSGPISHNFIYTYKIYPLPLRPPFPLPLLQVSARLGSLGYIAASCYTRDFDGPGKMVYITFSQFPLT